MSRSVDIAGQKFNMLKAIKPTEKRNSEGILWFCKCDCGKECYVSAKSLRNGNTKSCGCLKTTPEDITNQRFGKLTAIRPISIAKGKSTIWLCQCDCGNETRVEIKYLKYGNTKSCGCLNVDISAAKAREGRGMIDGTCIAMLKSKKIPITNTSGIKGVSKDKRSRKWEAYIKFKGTHYHLGLFKELADAAKARETAEENMHDDFVQWYEKAYRPIINTNKLRGKKTTPPDERRPTEK